MFGVFDELAFLAAVVLVVVVVGCPASSDLGWVADGEFGVASFADVESRTDEGVVLILRDQMRESTVILRVRSVIGDAPVRRGCLYAPRVTQITDLEGQRTRRVRVRPYDEPRVDE